MDLIAGAQTEFFQQKSNSQDPSSQGKNKHQNRYHLVNVLPPDRNGQEIKVGLIAGNDNWLELVLCRVFQRFLPRNSNIPSSPFSEVSFL